MFYSISTISDAGSMKLSALDLADVVGILAEQYGERLDVVTVLHDLLSGLEHVTRIDDVWLTVSRQFH